MSTFVTGHRFLRGFKSEHTASHIAWSLKKTKTQNVCKNSPGWHLLIGGELETGGTQSSIQTTHHIDTLKMINKVWHWNVTNRTKRRYHNISEETQDRDSLNTFRAKLRKRDNWDSRCTWLGVSHSLVFDVRPWHTLSRQTTGQTDTQARPRH